MASETEKMPHVIHIVARQLAGPQKSTFRLKQSAASKVTSAHGSAGS
jgi:hypothetical protein